MSLRENECIDQEVGSYYTALNEKIKTILVILSDLWIPSYTVQTSCMNMNK